MNNNENNYIKFSGISFIIAGVLFLTQYIFLLFPQFPPNDSLEIQKWLIDWKFNIAMSNEIFFFGIICLIPSITGLYKILIENDKILTIIGCGIFTLIITLLTTLCIFQGRLVYPVFNMVLSPDNLKLLLNIYYGGFHAVYLLYCIAVILLSFSMKRSGFGKSSIIIGIIAGVNGIIGSYSWLIGPLYTFITEIIFSTWFIYVGIKILILYKNKI